MLWTSSGVTWILKAIPSDGKTYEKNLREKMKHPGFASDIESLLPDGASYDLDAAFNYVVQEVVSRIDKVEKKNG